MRKIVATLCLTLFTVFTVNAQEGLKGAAFIGIPSGNATDYFGMNYGINISYLYPVFENVRLGAMVGLDLFSGKNIPNTNTKFRGASFLPVAVSGQFDLSSRFFAALDAGVEFSLNKDYKGGYFYQPKGGWQDEFYQVYVYLKRTSTNMDKAPKYSDFSGLTSFGLGVAYKF